MAQIEPFRGILYDRTRIEVDRVLAPPYDVIDEAAGAALADRHPENCVRLIRPEGEADARYDGAAERLQSWLAEGVLVRDQRPAIYRYHQSFAAPELGGRRITRRAFIAMVRLSDPGEGVIRPHARTRAASRIDRLRLMRATSAHLSPVFALYSDPSGRSDELLKRIERGTKPCVEATTDDGVAHTLWRVDDAETIGKLGRVLAPLNLYIADGHHRYEAMLAWRDELRERAGGSLGTWSEGEFATMCLANIEEEGTISRPIHRVVHGVADFDAARTLEQLGESFDVIAIRGGAGDADHLRDALRVADGDRPSFAAVLAGDDDAYLLTVKGRPTLDPGASSRPRVLGDVAVALVDALVLRRCLGLEPDADESPSAVSCVEDADAALARVAAGEAQACFLLGPVPVAQMRSAADVGERMPAKSIAFFPKVATGMVFNLVDPDRDLR